MYLDANWESLASHVHFLWRDKESIKSQLFCKSGFSNSFIICYIQAMKSQLWLCSVWEWGMEFCVQLAKFQLRCLVQNVNNRDSLTWREKSQGLVPRVLFLQTLHVNYLWDNSCIQMKISQSQIRVLVFFLLMKLDLGFPPVANEPVLQFLQT